MSGNAVQQANGEQHRPVTRPAAAVSDTERQLDPRFCFGRIIVKYPVGAMDIQKSGRQLNLGKPPAVSDLAQT